MIVVTWSLACVNDRDPFNKIVCEDRWFFHKMFGNLDFWEFCWSLVWDDPLKLNAFCSFFQTFLLYRNKIYLYFYNLRLTSLKTILTFLTSIFQLRPFGWFQTLYQKIQYFSKMLNFPKQKLKQTFPVPILLQMIQFKVFSVKLTMKNWLLEKTLKRAKWLLHSWCFNKLFFIWVIGYVFWKHYQNVRFKIFSQISID